MINAILGFPARFVCMDGAPDRWPHPTNTAAVMTRLEKTIETSFNRGSI